MAKKTYPVGASILARLLIDHLPEGAVLGVGALRALRDALDDLGRASFGELQAQSAGADPDAVHAMTGRARILCELLSNAVERADLDESRRRLAAQCAADASDADRLAEEAKGAAQARDVECAALLAAAQRLEEADGRCAAAIGEAEAEASAVAKGAADLYAQAVASGDAGAIARADEDVDRAVLGGRTARAEVESLTAQRAALQSRLNDLQPLIAQAQAARDAAHDLVDSRLLEAAGARWDAGLDALLSQVSVLENLRPANPLLASALNRIELPVFDLSRVPLAEYAQHQDRAPVLGGLALQALRRLNDAPTLAAAQDAARACLAEDLAQRAAATAS